MTAKVTVLIPTFNGEKFLAETIESLLHQSFKGFAIVVVDDASDDETMAVAQSFAGRGVRVVRNETRLGLAGNWNRCLDLVTTPLFVLAHQDDVYEPGYLATMVPLIESRPRAFMAHCKTISIDESGVRIDTPAARFKETLWPAENPYESDAASELPRLARGNYIICPSAMLRTEAVKKIGPFDTRFRFVTDWEYWVRGSAAGYSIVGTHERLVRFRRHETTATRATEMTFDRYREEVAMEAVIARAAEGRARLRPGSHPALRIIASEFASLLHDGETERARELLRFARTEIRGFDGSGTSFAMGLALQGGRFAGSMLKGLQSAAIQFERLRSRL